MTRSRIGGEEGEKREMAPAAPLPRVEVRMTRTWVRNPLVGHAVRSVEELAAMFAWMEMYAEERLVAVNMDDGNRLRHYAEIARGGASGLAVSLLDVVRPVLLTNCRGLALIHNHPLGDPSPSPRDRRFTLRVHRICQMLGIRFHGHLVLGWDGSFHEILTGREGRGGDGETATAAEIRSGHARAGQIIADLERAAA
ncbi:MAG: JAB domain-containing protein [Verrucomicrobiae bacterium]|nr:JAB domain-containing protein [Verrucomicrobiae bacterium]